MLAIINHAYPLVAVWDLISEMFFNKEDPAGWNICKPTRHSDTLLIVVSGRWQIAPADEVTASIIEALKGYFCSSAIPGLNRQGKLQHDPLVRFMRSAGNNLGWTKAITDLLPWLRAEDRGARSARRWQPGESCASSSLMCWFLPRARVRSQ